MYCGEPDKGCLSLNHPKLLISDLSDLGKMLHCCILEIAFFISPMGSFHWGMQILKNCYKWQ